MAACQSSVSSSDGCVKRRSLCVEYDYDYDMMKRMRSSRIMILDSFKGLIDCCPVSVSGVMMSSVVTVVTVGRTSRHKQQVLQSRCKAFMNLSLTESSW